jgi:hypothetical protein
MVISQWDQVHTNNALAIASISRHLWSPCGTCHQHQLLTVLIWTTSWNIKDLINHTLMSECLLCGAKNFLKIF